MWSKISSALKRPETPAQDFDTDDKQQPQTVLSTVFDRHPNLSVFHDSNEVPFPSPSPPASPSKHGRRGIFKRTAKTVSENDQVPQLPPLKLSIPSLKKVKSSLHGSTASDASSISRASTDSSRRRQSQDSIRPQLHDFAARTPTTPAAEGRFGSVRSILRDGNTPATGQSVRFFSRDAYKTITPDISNTSGTGSEPSPASFAVRMKVTSSTPIRPTVQDVFSPTQSSNLRPLPPPDDSNIFDLSQDIDLPPIPISKDSVPLLDNAIEIASDADTEGTALRIDPDGEYRSGTPSKHDRSQSFSFGQTVFHSIGAAIRDSPASNTSSSSSRRGSIKPKGNRNRAYSDTVFHSMLQAPLTPQKENIPPEADIDDRSKSALVLYPAPASPEKKKEQDPFGAHSTAYYTPGTGVPPTPPQAVQAHGRKASREEDLILSLRTQLALQTELCAQYEVDLRGKDELMRLIQSRFEECGRECERRKNVIRSWRKRVADLERCVQNLQLEVERSREESMERSVMDEASGYALRALHGQMAALEREKAELEKRERSAVEELEATREELYGTKDELSRRDEAERELKDGIARAREQMESMDVSMSLEEGERSHVFSTAGWDEERKALMATNEALRTEQLTLETQLADAREDALQKDNELSVLKAELEAQWRGTERQGEKIAELEKEKEELRGEVEALNARIGEMEVEWAQSENRKNELEAEAQELWGAKEELEKERDELDEHLRAEQEHSEGLTAALREREDTVSALEQEHKFALERAMHVEARLREREAELSDLMKKQSDREDDADHAQTEIAKMKREHARIVNDQSRKLQDVVAREVEARAAMETMVREKAETDVQISSLKERTNALTAEMERLRRQVHELQQESADKEVKLVQFAKQRAQDKEDLNGLNIALDSKQQELELLKRRMSVRGTAGNTPASSAKVPASRRESSIFGTPSVAARPSSVLSDTGSTIKDRRMSETPSTITKPALGRSVRTNGPSSASGSHAAKRAVDGAMGPPPSVVRSQSATAATPTRIPSGSGARATPSTIKAAANPRRMSASVLDASKLRPSTSSQERLHQERLQKLERLPSVSSASEPEKENSAPSSTSSLSSSTASTTAKVTRRMSAMPA